MNLYHYLSSSVSRYPEEIAVKYDGKSYTYQAFDERIKRLADALSNLGIKPGGKVALICRNSNAYLEIFFAAAMLGAVSEHFNWRFHNATILELTEASDASLVFISQQNLKFYHYLKERLTRQVTFVIVGETGLNELHYETLLRDSNTRSGVKERDAGDLAYVLYTSGTTGHPKGVQLSNFNYIMHSMVGIIDLNWASRTVFLCVLPLFHASASGAYNTLFMGGTIVIADKFDPIDYLRTIQEEKVTCIGQIPHLIEWLLNTPGVEAFDLSSLKAIIYSGANMSPETLRKAMKMFKCDFIQIYGMTELAPNVTALSHQEHLEFLEKNRGEPLPVGKATLGTRIRIDNGSGKPGDFGEILVASDSLMLGYYKQPELTAETIHDGWYHTGDAGYLDARGYLYLAGRIKQMIISGGENIFPKEVEQVIRNMGEEIVDVAVFGVPNERWGEVVKAVVVKRAGSMLTEKGVADYCGEHIDPYKKPRIVQFANDLPYNESGKVLYSELKKSNTLSDCYIDQRFFDHGSLPSVKDSIQ